MSRRTGTTNTNSDKPSSPFTSSSSYSTTYAGGAPLSPLPAMKKAKSQAVAYSLDNKNGQPPHVHFSPDIEVSTSNFNSTSMIDVEEEDPSNLSGDVVLDPNNVSNFSSNALSRASGTANLSRKKATPPQPQKKLVIKLLKGKPTLPSNFEETTWAKLKSAINAIFLKRPDPCDLEKLYQAVNDLCLHKMGGNLYQRIEKECEAHVSTALQSLVGQSEDLVVFLSLVEKCWQDFCDHMLMIRAYNFTLLLNQMGKFYELFEVGAYVGAKELDLQYIKSKGYRVLVVEQTETPEQLELHCKEEGSKDKVVKREICVVVTKGTLTEGEILSANPEASYLLAVTECR